MGIKDGEEMRAISKSKNRQLFIHRIVCMHIKYCGTYIVAAAEENWSAKWELLVYY